VSLERADLVAHSHYGCITQSAFQAKGHRSLRRHADFFAPGEQLSKRAAPGSCERPNADVLSSPKNRAHQRPDTRSTAGEFRLRRLAPRPLRLLSVTEELSTRYCSSWRDVRSDESTITGRKSSSKKAASTRTESAVK
jgi:hypothetical protein